MIIRLILFVFFILGGFVTKAQPWFQKASFGGTGRHRAVGIAIGNKGYIGTGHMNGTGVDISYKDWWQYDPASDSWTQKADFPMNEHGAVAFGTETRGYVGGGSALNGEFYCYNPVNNTWTSIASCPFSPGDTQGFSVHKGYVYSGNSFAEYDPSTDSWTMKPPVPIFMNSWSCSYGTNASGFVKSGTNFYEYKPSQDEWIPRASFPGLCTCLLYTSDAGDDYMPV
jgi:N-acetylneuraminic acid mutarotase